MLINNHWLKKKKQQHILNQLDGQNKILAGWWLVSTIGW